MKFLKCYQTKITLLSYSAIFFICLEKVDMIRVVAIVAQVSGVNQGHLVLIVLRIMKMSLRERK